MSQFPFCEQLLTLPLSNDTTPVEMRVLPLSRVLWQLLLIVVDGSRSCLGCGAGWRRLWILKFWDSAAEGFE